METKEFKNVSIILPTLNESFSFNQTVDIILEECEHKDIKEFIAVVCDRTLPESIEAIKKSQKVCEEVGVPLHILYQKRPFAGGAVADGFTKATGSHILMMAPDLETDPHNVKDFITMGKRYPNDMVTASRWLHKGSFAGYSKVKLVLNFFFQNNHPYSNILYCPRPQLQLSLIHHMTYLSLPDTEETYSLFLYPFQEDTVFRLYDRYPNV